ncbi:hypothetical protein LXL04_003597 [Taraxacum kok-saghyz]
MSSLTSDVGFTGRKSGPEQTRKLPEFTIGSILMLLSIRVEAEFAEELTEDHGTTFLRLDGRTEVGFFTTCYDKAKPNSLANEFRTCLRPRSVLQPIHISPITRKPKPQIRTQQSPPWFSAFCYLFSISAWVADNVIVSSLHGSFNNLPHVTISPFMTWKQTVNSFQSFAETTQSSFWLVWHLNWPKRDNRAGCPGFDRNAHQYRENHSKSEEQAFGLKPIVILPSDVGFTGRKPGPEQTRKLPEFTINYFISFRISGSKG